MDLVMYCERFVDKFLHLPVDADLCVVAKMTDSGKKNASLSQIYQEFRSHDKRQ